MSDSDSDDVPLSRKALGKVAVAKRPAISDSDSDVPLSLKAVAKRPPPASKPATPTSAAKATSAKPSPAKAATSAPAIKKEPVVKKEVSVKKEPVVKKEAAVKKEPVVKKEAVKKEAVVKATGAKAKKSDGAAKGAAKDTKGVKEQVVKVVREKKEYDLPGQTRDTPAETDPLRKYYTSLLQQRPGSQLAKKWCMQYGLLPRDEALQLLVGNKLKSPVKTENGGRVTGAKRAADTNASRAPPAKRVKSEPAAAAASKPKPKAAPAKAKATRKKANSSEDDADSEPSESDSDDDQPLSKRVK